MPSLAPYDAMATHVLELKAALENVGLSTNLYADEIKKEMRGEAIPFKRFRLKKPSRSRYMLYQLATGSNMVRHLIDRVEPLIIQYHNITPRSEFVRWDPGISSSMAWGQRQLEVLSKKAALGLAVSEFNARELVSATFPKVAISPPLIRSLDLVDSKRAYDVGEFKLLFVGRLAPNKGHEDLIRALAIYNGAFDKKAHLHLIGQTVVQGYVDYLHDLVVALGLDSWVHFSHGVSDQELSIEFASAHAYVSASKHEGFGFPFVEAMRTLTPIVAVASSAIPDTVGNGAILLVDNDPINMATAWSMVLSDNVLRNKLIKNGISVAHKWNLKDAISANLAALANVVPIPGIGLAPLFFDAGLELDRNFGKS